jgi:hypothetical protein
MRGSRWKLLTSLSLLTAALSCSEDPVEFPSTQTFRMRVLKVNDTDPPTSVSPLPPNTGERDDVFEVEIEAVGPDGNATDFDGWVRISIEPGSVVSVVDSSDGSNEGRNILIRGGKAAATITATASYGPTRLVVEDMGYVPAPEGATPACANGINDDDDEDKQVDYPNDPGCQFADDDTETAGTFAAGVSPTIFYELPSVQDVQGLGSTTPYRFESVELNTEGVHEVIVTRISKDGFYVTDLSDDEVGFNHLFVFNFSTPRNLRVCDRMTLLSGVVSEFFGYTSINFPSYRSEFLLEGDEDKCKVPDPILLEPDVITDAALMERYESGLVRLDGYHVSEKMGPKLALGGDFQPDQTNCDYNGDGRIDFESDAEGQCGTLCSDDPECTEWTQFVARGNYKVSKRIEQVISVIQVNTDAAAEFNPVANKGLELDTVIGTLRNFSGGNLNWTVETRCTDDLLCEDPGCTTEEWSPKKACVKLRTFDDNDEGSN